MVSVIAAALAVTALATAGNPPDPVQTNVVATGPGPCGIAARAGSIWVGVYGAGKLLQLDARTGRLETTVGVGPWACRVAVGPAAIWVTRDRAGEVVRIARGSGHIVRIQVGRGAFDVLLAARSAWTTSYDTGAIAKIDPARSRIVRVFRDGDKPAGLALCAGRIWVGHGGESTWLTAIDPATNAMHGYEMGTTNPGWPRCIRGVLWVTASGTLLKVDAETGKVRARLRLGGTLVEAKEGPDALVWVTDKERSLVHRIDAGQASVTDTFGAGPGAYSLARVEGAVWITSFAGADVRRYER
jgi:streptogramin lyase